MCRIQFRTNFRSILSEKHRRAIPQADVLCKKEECSGFEMLKSELRVIWKPEVRERT